MHEIEESIKISLQSIASAFFRTKGYTLIPFLPQMLRIDFQIIPVFCLDNRFTYDFPETIEYTQTGYSTGKLTKRFRTPIKMCTGILSSARKDIIQHKMTFECTNTACSNRTVCIHQNDILFLINPEEKTITKTVESKGCLRCGSILSKVPSSIKYEYVYILSIADTHDKSIKDRFITVRSIFDLSEVFPISNTKSKPASENKETLVLHGYIERDWKGIRSLRLLSCTSRTEINRSNFEIKNKILKVREEKRSTIEKLKDLTKEILFFKKKIIQTDIILVLIANIFNCKNTNYYCDVFADVDAKLIKNNLDNLMSSPESNRSNILEVCSEDMKSRRILVITNDVNYVLRLFSAISDVPVFLSIKDRRCKEMMEFVCVVDRIPKMKDSIDNLFDLQFNMQIDAGCFLDYSYYSVKLGKLPKMVVTLNEQEKKSLAEVFTSQRKLFKGVLKPYRLLKTTEELYLSVKYFTGGLKNFKVLEDFNKWIFY